MSYIIRPFRSDVDIFKSFDCNNADLNDFLIESDPSTPNATLYDKEFLAVTYIAIDEGTQRYRRNDFDDL